MFSNHSLRISFKLSSSRKCNAKQGVFCALQQTISQRETSLPYSCKYYNTNHSNSSSPQGNAAPFHHVNSLSNHYLHHQEHNHGNQHRFLVASTNKISEIGHDQQLADYHQALNILRELNHIRQQNHLLNKQINHLQEYVQVKEDKSKLSSWMDTNPFKFGLLCGSVVFVLIALRLDLEKNRTKVKELREELAKLSIRRRFGNN